MKVAFLWPDYWPYIRRGTERLIHDSAVYLAARGHEVHIIASKPGRSMVRMDGPIKVILMRQVSHPLFIRMRWVPRWDTFGFTCLGPLLQGGYDLVHCMFYVMMPAVRMAKRLRRLRYLYHVVNMPPSWPRPMDGWMLRRTLAGATRIRSLSDYCAEQIKSSLGVQTDMIYPPVDTQWFQPQGEKKRDGIRILFTADLMDPRKGGALLIHAFNSFARRHPNSVLQLAGPTGYGLASALSLATPEAAKAIEVLGPGSLRSLPRVYTQATMTVLPSLEEPFGMVLTESLACGTPVVGTRSGGIPEILCDPSVGALFERPGGESPEEQAARLDAALERTYELSLDGATAGRCRQHAMRFGWDAVGPALERQQTLACDGAGT